MATLVPSLTYETFGLVSLESFARQTPVIARNRGGLAEVIELSEGGILYESDDEAIQAIQRLVDSPRLGAEMGLRGYQSFLRHWTQEEHLRQYFGLIHQAALKRHGHLPWES